MLHGLLIPRFALILKVGGTPVNGANANDRRRDLQVPTRPLATVDHSSLSNSLPELNAGVDRRSRSLLNPVTDEMIRYSVDIAMEVVYAKSELAV